tara:strand:+ start:756 stop:1280 length:525 start_codon:yes stop_codon:yes gene_type:complete
MTINYTIKSVAKDNIVVTYEGGVEVNIPINTWVDKSWIEAHIRMRYRESDQGTLDDIPFKAGDTGSIPTYQENEDSRKKAYEDYKTAFNSATFDYKLIRRILYPYINDQIGALVKAVITGDKTELESLNTKIEKVKTDYPKDSKAYTQTELKEARTNTDNKNHFPPYSQPGPFS